MGIWSGDIRTNGRGCMNHKRKNRCASHYLWSILAIKISFKLSNLHGLLENTSQTISINYLIFYLVTNLAN